MADVPDTFLSSLPPDSLAIITVVVSLALAEELSINDMNTFGNLITAIGSVLLTIAAQEQMQRESAQEALSAKGDSSDSSNGSGSDKDIQDMKKQIEELQKQIKMLNCRR